MKHGSNTDGKSRIPFSEVLTENGLTPLAAWSKRERFDLPGHGNGS
jgi:hypothetical protein